MITRISLLYTSAGRRFLNTMSVRFLIPKDMSSVHDGEVCILSDDIKVGQKVTKNQFIMQIDTAKATIDECAPVDGIISKIHVKKGDVINKNFIIYEIDY